MQDAARPAIQAADTIGIRVRLVRALDDLAKALQRLGVDESPLDPMALR